MARNTVAGLNQRLREYAEGLAQDTERAAREVSAFLEFVERLGVGRYSLGNMMLIWHHCPHATMVAGFDAWKKFGRYVKKDEKGIPIFVPMWLKPREDDPEQKPKLWFGVGYVFDVSQTDGEPLPEEPEWKTPARLPEAERRLKQWAAEQGIQVEVCRLRGETQGLSHGDGRIQLSPEAGLKTLVHELVHELMHKEADRLERPRDALEVEAETAAHLVCRSLGLETNSRNYLALRGTRGEDIMASLGAVLKVAEHLLKVADPERFKDKEGKNDN